MKLRWIDAWLAAAAGVVAAACASSPSGFTCSADEQCMSAGIQGICETNGICSFPDDSCESGWRYSSTADSPLAGFCVESDATAAASTTAEATSSAESTSTGTGGSGASSDGSTGASACVARYGSAERFELCEETVTTCRFSVVLRGDNCEWLCTSFGGRCLESFSNDAGMPCDAGPSGSCYDDSFDRICVCTVD